MHIYMMLTIARACLAIGLKLAKFHFVKQNHIRINSGFLR